MRLRVFVVGVLLCSVSMVRADEKLPMLKVGTDVYSNVTITVVTATDIQFSSDQGGGIIKLKNLDPAMQKHFSYDAATAKAAEQKAGIGGSTALDASGIPKGAEIDMSNPAAALDEAMSRVRAIINQPVVAYRLTRDLDAARYPFWFHEGAIHPDFDTVDIRATQEHVYDSHPYVFSDLNPGFCYKGTDLEFNSMTKFFYTDRTLPKKKLTEPQMLEINRLYRIMGQCEKKMQAARMDKSAGNSADATSGGLAVRSFIEKLVPYKKIIMGAVGGVIVLLLLVRIFGKKSEV